MARVALSPAVRCHSFWNSILSLGRKRRSPLGSFAALLLPGGVFQSEQGTHLAKDEVEVGIKFKGYLRLGIRVFFEAFPDSILNSR